MTTIIVYNTNTNDADCDGISTTEDCDDNDQNAGQIEEKIVMTDNDCDGDLMKDLPSNGTKTLTVMDLEAQAITNVVYPSDEYVRII